MRSKAQTRESATARRRAPFVSSARAASAAEEWPETFRGYEVVIGAVVIYDDPQAAADLAAELGTELREAPMRQPSQHEWFSVVALPDDWAERIKD